MTKCGIYAIRRKENGDCYVGSTVNFGTRFGQHRKMLTAGKHHSPHLQSAWVKYGSDAFEFVVLEYLREYERKQFLSREQSWIDDLSSRYNCSRYANRPAHRGPGWHHDEKTKAKMSEALKNSVALKEHHARQKGQKRPHVGDQLRGRTQTPEHTAKVAAAQKGKPCPARSLAQKGKTKPHMLLPRTVAWKAKMSERMRGNKSGLGAKHSPEAIERSRQGSLGTKRSYESREKMRRAQLAYRDKVGRKSRPLTRRPHQSIAMQGYHAAIREGMDGLRPFHPELSERELFRMAQA